MGGNGDQLRDGGGRKLEIRRELEIGRGSEIRGQNGRAVQIVPKKIGFTRARQQLFLDAVAATCNVREAQRVAGVGSWSVYHLRRVDPAFAAAWDRALDIGYLRLEETLLARAVAALDADGREDAVPGGFAIDADAAPVAPLPSLAAAVRDAAATPEPAGAGKPRGPFGRDTAGDEAGMPVAFRLALSLLNRRRGIRERDAGRNPRKALSSEEVDALLIAKLDRLDRIAAKGSRNDGGEGAA